MDIRLTISGKGAPLVLIAGMPQPVEHLAHLYSALASTHRVVLLDLPGYGASPAPAGAYDLDEVDRAVAAALSAANATEASFIAMSGGTYRVLKMTLDRLIAPSALVLLAPMSSVRDEDRAGFRGLSQALRGGVDLDAIVTATVPRMFSKAWAAAHPERALEVVHEMVHAASPALIAAELDAFAASPDLGPRLPEVRARVALRVGADDVATPLPAVRALEAALPNATLEIAAGCGHLLQFEDPDGTLAFVRAAVGAP